MRLRVPSMKNSTGMSPLLTTVLTYSEKHAQYLPRYPFNDP